jgi:hypothetical protein
VLAEQLLTFAQDFIAEYRKYDILGMAQATINILARRGSLNDAAYNLEADPLRQKCETIMHSSRFNTYPTEWQRVISKSRYVRFLPAKAAKVISEALPSNRDFAPQSPEMQLFHAQCANTWTVTANFIPFAQQFDLSGIAIPKDELGVIVELPRRIFENEAGNFSDTLKKFSDLIAALSEVVSGKRSAPRMLYASTSDPIVILSTILEVAAPFLSLYTDVLEAAVKTLEIAKAFGIIREAGGVVPDTPDVTGPRLRISIDRLIDAHEKIGDEGRRKELHNELLLRVEEVMPSIRAGARLSIAATTNENTVTQIVGDSGTIETLTRQSRITQKLEIKLDNLAAEPALQIVHQEAN